MLHSRILALIFPLFLYSAAAPGNSPVPLQDLIKHADIQQVKISPKGTHLAVRKLYKGEHMLLFMSLNPLRITGHLRFRGKEEVGWSRIEDPVLERGIPVGPDSETGEVYLVLDRKGQMEQAG